MKKLFLTVSIFVLLGITLSTQAEENGELGMSAGDIALEVDLRPANDFPIQMNNIKARYDLGGNMIARAGFLFDIYSESDKDSNMEYSKREIDFGLYPGVEMHFPVNERVSPYFGGEVGFFTRSTKELTEPDVGDDEELINVDGRTEISLNIIGGCDVYLYEGLYIGLELGYGFTRTSFPDVEKTEGTTSTSTVNNETELNIGDNVNTAIRLGWHFSL